MKVIIELEFDQTPSQEDVYDYLNALMRDSCLDWHVEEEVDEDTLPERKY
tara:strand:+ start:388 stop:537 length:150 start_codon:yes stop_codon:yes gene_type:complete